MANLITYHLRPRHGEPQHNLVYDNAVVRPSRTKKVLVAMSGGVDSSVTAALLQKQGYEVVGCFMRLGSNASGDLDEGHDNHDAARCSNPAAPQHRGSQLRHQGCCSLNDAADARLVAAQLDIPLYVLNFTKDFDKVIDYFVKEYNAGRTPNPCIRCNDWLKFGKLASYADSIDADFIATGHYARVDPSAGTGRPARLLCGIDARKDQSYFLFSIPRQRLEQMILPIGEMTKPQVRRLAESLRLPVFDKPDSQEICFVPDNDYAKLIERRTPRPRQLWPYFGPIGSGRRTTRRPTAIHHWPTAWCSDITGVSGLCDRQESPNQHDHCRCQETPSGDRVDGGSMQLAHRSTIIRTNPVSGENSPQQPDDPGHSPSPQREQTASAVQRPATGGHPRTGGRVLPR